MVASYACYGSRRCTATRPRCARVAVWLITGWVLVCGEARNARSQVIDGRVLDAATGAGLSGANIVIRGSEVSLDVHVPDSLGRFRVTLPKPGRYTLQVDRIGYATLAEYAFSIDANELLEVEVHLAVAPVALGSVVATTRRTKIGAHADYYRRLEFGRLTGSGDFVTRADFEAVQLPFVTSYLGRLPSVMLWTDTKTQKTHPRLAGGCIPVIYLNGVATDLRNEPGAPSIDDFFSSEELEGLEIYRRQHIPIEYARPDVCGVIIAWTRLPQSGHQSSALKLMIGGSIITGLLLLTIF